MTIECLHDALMQIQQSLKAPKDAWNAFSKYNYRSAESILEALKPLLAANACTLTMGDGIEEVGGRIYVKATVTLCWGGEHLECSAYAREEETKKGMDAAQITGSASSYARKYALSGMFCIDDNKDADTRDNRPAAPAPAKPAPAVQQANGMAERMAAAKATLLATTMDEESFRAALDTQKAKHTKDGKTDFAAVIAVVEGWVKDDQDGR